MTLAEIWAGMAAVIAAIPQSGLLMAVVGALACGWIGGLMVRRRVPLGQLIRTVGTAGLAAILIIVVLQLSRFEQRLDIAVPELGLPQQVVGGSETRVPIASDGHFWLRAQVNGQAVDFMVDTGATLTAVSKGVAQRAGLEPRRGGIPISLKTANGVIAAQISSIDTLRFGNVAAHGLDAVVLPNSGETNVIGMNFLSRLKSWRVEGSMMIMVPHHPQPAELSR